MLWILKHMLLLSSGPGVSAAVGNPILIVGRDAGTCSVSSERIAFGQLRASAQVQGQWLCLGK